MSRRTAIALSLIASLLTAASFAEEPPAKRFASQIQRCKEAANYNQNDLTGLLNLAGQAPAFTKADMSLITKHITQATDTWNSAAAAFEKGGETEGNALIKRGDDLDRNRDRWSQRLYVRLRQAQFNEYLPATAETYDSLVSGRKPRDAEAAEALMETKKARSEAYGRLADATTPAADQETLDKLTDEVFAAETEVQVAILKWNWSNDDLNTTTWITPDRTVTSPELAAAIERIAESRKSYEATYRQLRTHELAIEHLKRAAPALHQARVKAYQTAKEASDRAAAQKH